MPPRPAAHLTLMTLAGLVNHLRWVEYYWFQVVLLGEDDHGPWTEEDPDREMRIAVHTRSPGCWPTTKCSARATEPSWPPWTWTPRPSGPSMASPSRCAGRRERHAVLVVGAVEQQPPVDGLHSWAGRDPEFLAEQDP